MELDDVALVIISKKCSVYLYIYVIIYKKYIQELQELYDIIPETLLKGMLPKLMP